MIEILPAPPHVAAFRFTGTLTGEDYDRGIAAIEDKLAGHDRIAILSDLTGMTEVTTAALGKDLRYALGKIGEYRRFARGAVITEREWLARATSFAGIFFPHTQVRTYEPHEREAALAWVAEPLPPGK